MRTVRVADPSGEDLLKQLDSLYLTFKELNEEGKVLFDLSRVSWTFPLLLLPVASYINDTKSLFIHPGKPEVKSYLETVSFPYGVDTPSKLKWGRSYIPIVHLKGESPGNWAELQYLFSELVYKVLEPAVEVKAAIIYPLYELLQNILDHSERNEGHLFSQYYPTKEFLDLCIVDRGIGLANSYRRRGLQVNDEEAMSMALEGRSVKEGRGFGIRTSKKVVCEGLNGEFVLVSGGVALYSSKNYSKLYSLKNFYWKGVIGAWRIPKPEGPVDIYSYIE